MAKKGPFTNPLAPKERVSSKAFVAPTKEQATTGKFMASGDYYGTGFRQPVGKFRGSNEGQNPVPKNSHRMDPKSLA